MEGLGENYRRISKALEPEEERNASRAQGSKIAHSETASSVQVMSEKHEELMRMNE